LEKSVTGKRGETSLLFEGKERPKNVFFLCGKIKGPLFYLRKEGGKRLSLTSRGDSHLLFLGRRRTLLPSKKE